MKMKNFPLSYIFLLVIVPFLDSNQTLAITTEDFYKLGVEDRVLALEDGDNVIAMVYNLSEIFSFYGFSYTTVYVTSDGLITFEDGTGFNSVAPFFADADTTGGVGNVTYGETSDPDSITMAAEQIQAAFSKYSSYTPLSLFIATWKEIGYFDQHSDLRNTFQCVLATNGSSASFVIFLYPENGIQWTAADSEGGVNGRFSGPSNMTRVTPYIGFVGPNGEIFYHLFSGTEAVLELPAHSNVGVPGVWVFEVTQNVTEPDNVCNFDPCEVGQTCVPGTHPADFSCTGRAAILLYPGDTEASAQSSLVLTCVAFGIPAPEIVWEHNNLTLTSPHSNITTEIFSNDTGLFAVSVLNLCNVELSDSGQYSCLASNSGMNTETRSFTLNIQAPPNITAAPMNLTVSQLSEVELTCVVSGAPLAEVEWLMDAGEGLVAITVDNSLVRLEFGQESDTVVISTLTLTAIQPSQSGKYVCWASNLLGNNTAEAYVNVYVLTTTETMKPHTTDQASELPATTEPLQTPTAVLASEQPAETPTVPASELPVTTEPLQTPTAVLASELPDPCLQSPCGTYANCVRESSQSPNFICECLPPFVGSGSNCTVSETPEGLTQAAQVGIGVAVGVACVVTIILLCICVMVGCIRSNASSAKKSRAEGVSSASSKELQVMSSASSREFINKS